MNSFWRIAWLLFVAVSPLSAQDLVVNGDFEMTTATGCEFNLSNAEFTAMVVGATAFSTFEETDVMLDPSGCGYGSPPVSGTTKIGLAMTIPPSSDAISLQLTSDTVAGDVYTLRVWIESVFYLALDEGLLEVGISSAPDTFGSLVATLAAPSGGWFQQDVQFQAPVTGGYLTLRPVGVGTAGCWIHIDDVSLEPAVGAFRRGDLNEDGAVDVSDVVFTLGALFIPGSPQPSCFDAADANDDGMFDVSDAVEILFSLFVPGSMPLAAPGAFTCGTDPTPDALDCVAPCP